MTASGCARAAVAVALTLGVLAIPAHAEDHSASAPPPKCDGGSCLDPLFTVQFPHTGSTVLRSGVRIFTPVHYYDADLFMTVGYADAAAERRLTKETPYEPVLTESGRALAAMMFAVYHDDDLGPYNEGLVAFPVHNGGAVIPDDDGAMVGALLDPSNEVWGTRLVLNRQLPIDAGREYLGIPKVPSPRSVELTINPRHVSINVTDKKTPVVYGDIRLDPATSPSAAADVMSQRNTLSSVMDILTRNYLRLRFVYDDVRHHGAVGHTFVAARVGTNVRAAVASYGPDSSLQSNPREPFGSDAAALGLRPKVSLVILDLHAVLDATL